MSNDLTEAEPDTRKKKARRVRRNFAVELQDLQSRVNFAVSILEECDGADVAMKQPLVRIALKTLQGE